MSDCVSFGSFNILADGLSSGEFLCEGGDAGSTDWAIRKDKIISILANMLNKCDAVVTQENDHFVQILSALRDVYHLDVAGVFGTNVRKPSKANQFRVAKQTNYLRNCQYPDPTPSKSSSSYEACNCYFRVALVGSTPFPSFREESVSFGATFAAIYGNELDDLYQSDDGVGIYYRVDKLQLEGVHLPGRIAQSTNTTNMTLVSNMEYVLACTFHLVPSTISSPYKFTLYGAHLSSGEDVTKEHARCRQLYAILNDAQHQVNPIIAMDSNSSCYYELAYPDTRLEVDNNLLYEKSASCIIESSGNIATNTKCYIPGMLSKLIEQFNYIDAVGPDYQIGNECFKMRHGLGGQPSKHYQFMFDTIDKILIPQSMTLLPFQYDRSAFGFTRYDPSLREQLIHLRTSPMARRELAMTCRVSPHINNTTCSHTAFGTEHLLSGLYPNKQAPSDHPPVVCCVLLS